MPRTIATKYKRRYTGYANNTADARTRRLAFDPLTAREIDILKLVASGMGNRQAGDAIGLTEHTVKGYLKSIVSKLGAGDRTAAVVIAVQRGLIEVEKLETAFDRAHQ